MRRWLPHLALLLTGLVLLGIGGAWYLGASFDLVALEAQLALEVRERTGHDLRLEELELRVLPLPGLVVTGLELGAAPGFGPEPLLRVERSRARLKLRPLLLRGELELGTVALEGLQLRLVRSATGRGSWETLLEHLQAGVDPSAPPSSLQLDRLVLRDARVSFEALDTGRSLSLDPLQLGLGPLGEGTVPILEIDAVLQDPQAARELALTVTTPLERSSDEGSLVLEGLTLELLGHRLEGTLRSHGGEQGPVIEGALRVPDLDLRGLARDLGRELPLEDPTALGSGSLALAFHVGGGLARFDELTLAMDDSTVTGSVSVRGLEPPVVAFDLDIDRMDLDRYGLSRPASSEASLTPKAWLGGQLRVGQLSSGEVVLRELVLPLDLRGEDLRVDGARARLLGGEVEASLDADLGSAVPRYRVAGRVQDLSMTQLLEATGSSRDLTGTLNLELDLEVAGVSRPQLLSTLDGQLCVALLDGEMPLRGEAGIRPEQEGERHWQLRRLERQLGMVRERLVVRAQEKLEIERPEQLVYARQSACFELDDGLARSDDMLVDAERLRLEGAGSIDLNTRELELAWVLTMEGLPPMELRLHGSADDPQVDLDRPGALDLARHRIGLRLEDQRAQAEAKRAQAVAKREQLREGVQERREEVREQLKDKTGEGVDRLLDHREQAVERRDELREQARQTRQDLRGQLREARQALREQRQADADGNAPAQEVEPEG